MSGEIVRQSQEEPRTVALKTVWPAPDATVERDVLEFWEHEKLLPANADRAARVKELCVVAYDGPIVVGSVEAHLNYVDFLCARMATFRVAVAVSHRRSHVATTITLEAQKVLEGWSLAHPEEKLMGIGGNTQARNLSDKLREAVLQPTGFALVNYNEKGEQYRLVWFKHANID
jgi:hypothetical protein